MKVIIDLYSKYKSIFWYLVFGVLTTIINVVTFWGLSYCEAFKVVNKIIGIKDANLIINTAIAWLVAVIFAYITNKKWVFDSKANNSKEILKEIGIFFSCRITTGVIDVIVVYVFVSVLHFPSIIIKLLSNILVIILNYVGSKLIVFKNK